MRAVLAVGLFATACGRLNFGTVTDGARASDVGNEIGGDVGGDGTAPVAPTFVQKIDAEGAGIAGMGLQLLQPVTAGDLIVATVDFDSSSGVTLSTISDGLGPFTVLPVATDAANNFQYIAYRITEAAATYNIGTTLTASSDTYLSLRVHEYAGVDPVTPFDTYGGLGSPDGVTLDMQLPLVTATANELLFAIGVSNGGTITAGAGFNARTTTGNDLTEDVIATTPGPQLVTAVNTLGYWTLSAAAFRAL